MLTKMVNMVNISPLSKIQCVSITAVSMYSFKDLLAWLKASSKAQFHLIIKYAQ